MFPLSDEIQSRRFPIINIGLILATFYVFFLQLTATDPEAFIRMYALIPALVDFNISETLLPFITSIFLHGGFLHIISNMWFLWVFGDNVEGYLNHITYPLLYLLSGIVGGLSQYVLSPQSSIPMLGASGAVAGVLGAYLVMFPHSKIKTLVPFFGFISIANIPATVMLGYWFVLQLVSGTATLTQVGVTGGVAFWAHVGGFVTGVVLAKLFQR